MELEKKHRTMICLLYYERYVKWFSQIVIRNFCSRHCNIFVFRTEYVNFILIKIHICVNCM